jgi:hypothetical protein
MEGKEENAEEAKEAEFGSRKRRWKLSGSRGSR